MRILQLVIFLLITSLSVVKAQTPAIHSNLNWKTVYRATPEKINSLVHTKLVAKLNFQNATLEGKVWITLKPHFYATDTLRLDAKGMLLKEVGIFKSGKVQQLKYDYSDSANLFIKLDKAYTAKEQYTVYIEYIARPNNWKASGSNAISGAKGLYFINPKGEEKGKPTQVWTQGETEATSVWVPTIDRPNQKTTQEMVVTVPAKYVTLSNGKNTSSKLNSDGTRTDTWKMELPHAPYLFFLGVGDYAIVKDSYKGKEVSYYVEKPYEGVARKIFGNTPEMMGFFSKLLGVDYPWVKYSQMVARDYVSGAMENTTATLHQETAQQDARELLDENRWEDVISHELIHHWFGDLVTTESWSNLSMNESFADYGEYLWREHKYGKDAADDHGFQAMQAYLANPGESSKDLVRFYYKDKEDMFDQVSYQKGGRILHMLRNYLGDSAFFKSLNLFLNQNKFGTAEAHQLRLASEEVSGKDLNWFFNQWFFGSGHPVLTIKNDYDDKSKKLTVIVNQTQKGDKYFRLPTVIDIYQGANKTSHKVWLNKNDTFEFSVASKPSLVNVDAERALLAVKKESKDMDEYLHQFKYGGTFMDRREAIVQAASKKTDPVAAQIVSAALSDLYQGIRRLAIEALDSTAEAATIQRIEKMAKNDPSRLVRADAISYLGSLKKAAYKQMFIEMINDSSYSVAGASLEGLFAISPKEAIAKAKQLAVQPAKGRLKSTIVNLLIYSGEPEVAESVLDLFTSMGLQEKLSNLEAFSQFVGAVENTEIFKKGVDEIIKLSAETPAQYRDQIDFYIYNIVLVNIVSRKEAEIKAKMGDVAELQKQVNYVKEMRAKMKG